MVARYERRSPDGIGRVTYKTDMGTTILPLFQNTSMKVSILGLCLLIVSVPSLGATQERVTQTAMSSATAETMSLSKEKWRWISERKVDSLAALFHEEAVFVHMGATMSKNLSFTRPLTP